MKLYNTLSRKKEQFVPLVENNVTMYVCGPTVYNYIHIGNARPYIIFDTIRRYLEYKGYNVNYVQNFTDVDDKIIKRANEENSTMEAIANKYIEETKLDAKNLNIKEATKNPRVTEEIDEIINMVKILIDKGFAYEKNGTVYFNTEKFEHYGKLSKKNIDELEVGIRIAVDSEKQNPMDFVLWKPAKQNEPKWSSPWGEGRPGWHIECSAMAKKYLGDSIDIHAGGEDLIFPHHENEIAQSEAANGKPFAKYWLHNGFINVDNKKMSKSTGNFFTLREIAEKFDHSVIRFFMLSAHYRNPLNFSEELMQSAENSLNRIKNCIFDLQFLMDNLKEQNIHSSETILLNECDKFKTQFEQSMDDDFNTADAVTAIFEFVKFANINATQSSSIPFVKAIHDKIVALCDILGIALKAENTIESNFEAEVEALIEQRKIAKENKDYKTADQIREKLSALNVVLEDTRSGVRWKVVKWMNF